MHQSALEMIVSEQTPNDVLSCNLLFIIPRLILSRHMHAGHGRIQRVTGFNSPKAFISVATVKMHRNTLKTNVYTFTVSFYFSAPTVPPFRSVVLLSVALSFRGLCALLCDKLSRRR